MTANPDLLLDDRSRPDATLDLDTRILLAEQRLIAREEKLHRSVHTMGLRLRQAVRRPKELIVPAVGGAAALAGLWWGWSSRRSASAAKSAPPPAGVEQPAGGRRPPPGAPGGGFPWVRMVALGWPLLPKHVRAKVSPTTATTAITIGLPLVEALLGAHKPAKPPVQSALQVDLVRYAGTWHEIARLPAPFEALCDGQPTASYRLRRTPRGSEVEVINSCCMLDGKTRASRGVALPVPGAGGSRLKVSLFPKALRWLPFAWADYWILHVDDSYSVALVGNPGRNFLWVLARRPRIPPSTLQALVEMARAQGFAVERLKVVEPR